MFASIANAMIETRAPERNVEEAKLVNLMATPVGNGKAGTVAARINTLRPTGIAAFTWLLGFQI
jgi:hypothetical protein